MRSACRGGPGAGVHPVEQQPDAEREGLVAGGRGTGLPRVEALPVLAGLLLGHVAEHEVQQGGRRPHAAAAYLVLYGDESARLNVPENFSLEERAEAAEDMLADVLESAA